MVSEEDVDRATNSWFLSVGKGCPTRRVSDEIIMAVLEAFDRIIDINSDPARESSATGLILH